MYQKLYYVLGGKVVNKIDKLLTFKGLGPSWGIQISKHNIEVNVTYDKSAMESKHMEKVGLYDFFVLTFF